MQVRRLGMFLGVLMTVVAMCLAGCAPGASSSGDGGDAASQEQITWNLQCPFPVTTHLYAPAIDVSEWVTLMSNGRLTINHLGGGAIVPGGKEMTGVSEGSLDAGMTVTTFHTGIVGYAGDMFNEHPAGPEAEELMVWIYQGGGLELWQEMYDRLDLDVHVVGPASYTSAEGFGWFSEPVTSMDDFKGMKFRTAGCWGEILSRAGATVVSMQPGELFEAMQRGTIDAFEFSTPGVDYSGGFHEMGAYLTFPGIHGPGAMIPLLVNKDRWNELSPDLQAIVTHACEAAAINGWARANYSDVMAMQALQDYGTEFVSLPESVQSEIADLAFAFYEEKAAEDPFFAKVFESQKTFVSQYRAVKALQQPDIEITAYKPVTIATK